MPYVYRYIDIKQMEVVYIGKVSGFSLDNLGSRHAAHQREQWYKDMGSANVLLQYIETESHADADILETYLISRYAHTGQLFNKAKADWGKSSINWFPGINAVWHDYDTSLTMGGYSVASATQDFARTVAGLSDSDRSYAETQGLIEKEAQKFAERVIGQAAKDKTATALSTASRYLAGWLIRGGDGIEALNYERG